MDSVLSTTPQRSIVNTETGIEVTYDFSAAVIMRDDLFPNRYLWKIDGFGMNGISGTPSTLQRVDRFGIPDGKAFQIDIVETAYRDFEYVLSPARSSSMEDGTQAVRPIDPAIEVYPETPVGEECIQTYRGKGILNVRISPILYNIVTGKTRAFTHIKYVVNFMDKGEPSRVLSGGDRPAHSIAVDDNFLSNTLLNASNEGSRKATASTRLNQQDYLIISVPEYESAVKRFAEWKKLMGFNVHILIRSNWTAATVKSEVQKVYNENAHLYFMLIIGDHEDVPTNFLSHSSSSGADSPASHITDLPYACMDGESDVLPDLYMGRLSVSSPSEADIVINKVIDYERNPVTAASFYGTGVNCSFFEDGRILNVKKDGYADNRFVQTSEDVRNYLMTKGKSVTRIYYTPSDVTPTHWNKGEYSYGEPLPQELLKPGFAWNGNADDILRAVNQGAFYVLHHDHGLPSMWEHPQFTIEDIGGLSNGNKLPVVFSINCETGKFDNKECFAEAFLRKANGGCVAIFGSTMLSKIKLNDVLIGGMFDAIWPNPGLRIVLPTYKSTGTTPAPTYRLGQILQQGLSRVSEVYGATNEVRCCREMYHCFGDPSMRIYTEQPTNFSGVAVNRGTNRVAVTLPGGEATITFYNMASGEVVSYVGTTAVYTTASPQYVTVCISGHNKIPHVDGMTLLDDLFIQNETISGTQMYFGKTIKVGSNVTTAKPQGNVVIKSDATVNFHGTDIQLHPGTTIELGAKVNITTL
ncbi:MAG: C25 family cysteine peptidase [Ruminococcus flavefaciens]|nr:C25 family cysteine peptidase [Ruminococcus flavefaciens]